jgi:hypothetical protein
MARKGTHIGKLIFAAAAAAYFFWYVHTSTDWHFLDNVNLIIHEAGHVVFSPFGQFIYLLGGSLFQVLVPIIFSSYFFLRGQNFSGSILLYWVGQNLINVSIYAGDAVVMQLPLLGGDTAIHDWNAILTMASALPYTHQVAGSIYGLGIACVVLAAAGSFYFAWSDAAREEAYVREY